MRFDKKYLVEFLGTAIFMFVVCGVAMFIGAENSDILQTEFNIYANMNGFLIAFVAGVTYILLYLVFSKYTVCHFNPIFSFAYWIDGRIRVKEFMAYVVSQMLGTIVGVESICKMIEYMRMSDMTKCVLGIKRICNNEGRIVTERPQVGAFKGNLASVQGKMGSLYPEAVAFILEVVLAFVLVWVVLKISSDKNIIRLRGVFIGISMCMVYWIGIPYTSTMLNPAKEIATMLVNWSLDYELLLNELWIFFLGPILGAAIAVGIYKGDEVLEKYEQLIGSIIFIIFSTEIIWNLFEIYKYDIVLDVSAYENYEIMYKSAITNFLAPIGMAGSFLLAHFICGSKRITMFNPIMSIAQFMAKQISKKQCISDVIFQIIGMFVGFISLVL